MRSRIVAVRGGIVVYILFVGLVFDTLLTGVDLGTLQPWVNAIVHVVVPVLGLVDWILWPPRRRLPMSVIGWWMLWPAVYAIAAVVRGGVVDGFSPYPFFDPAQSGGYGGVLLLCLAMVGGFLVFALVVWGLGNWQHDRRWRDEAAAAETG